MLLGAFGLFGVRLAVTLLRDGMVRTAPELARGARGEERGRGAARDPRFRLRRRAATSSRPAPRSVRCDGALREPSLAADVDAALDLERIVAGAHEFAEMNLLDECRAAPSPFRGRRARRGRAAARRRRALGRGAARVASRRRSRHGGARRWAPPTLNGRHAPRVRCRRVTSSTPRACSCGRAKGWPRPRPVTAVAPLSHSDGHRPPRTQPCMPWSSHAHTQPDCSEWAWYHVPGTSVATVRDRIVGRRGGTAVPRRRTRTPGRRVGLGDGRHRDRRSPSRHFGPGDDRGRSFLVSGRGRTGQGGTERDRVLRVRVDGHRPPELARDELRHEWDARAAADEQHRGDVGRIDRGRPQRAAQAADRLRECRADHVLELGAAQADLGLHRREQHRDRRRRCRSTMPPSRRRSPRGGGPPR